jgi:hypothetical protein
LTILWRDDGASLHVLRNCLVSGRHRAAAERLERLVAEMKRVGLWSAPPRPPYPERPYAARFVRAETRFVFWEMVLDHPAPGRRVPVEFESVFFRPDGSEWARQTLPTGIEADWTWSHHHYRWGWEVPGHWAPGRYRVAVRLWDEEQAAGEFEIE